MPSVIIAKLVSIFKCFVAIYTGPMLYLFGHQDVSEEGVASDAIEYSLRGYAVLVSLSALYFFLSAITLRYIKKRGV